MNNNNNKKNMQENDTTLTEDSNKNVLVMNCRHLIFDKD